MKVDRTMAAMALGALCSAAAGGEAGSWRVDLQLGAVWADHNEVEIPNDGEGDRFDIADLGTGPYPLGRLTVGWRPWQRHDFQLVIAPLAYEERGTFDRDLRFAGATFAGGAPTDVSYQFNSYRLRYLYSLVDRERWLLELGGTLFVRDARIELTQGGTRAEDSDLGFVPLFALKTSYRVNPRWSLVLDSDFAWAPQGRAIDLALLAERRMSRHWALAAGYRTIEGGADNDSVYTFAWFNAAVLRVGYQW